MHFIDWALKMGQALPELLLSLPVPMLIGIMAIPLVLAAFSGSGIGIAGTAVLVLLASALLAQASRQGNDACLPLLAYAAAVLVAMNGYEAQNRRRVLIAQAREVERIRKETKAFLDALERRAQVVDRIAAGDPAKTVSAEGISEESRVVT